MYEVNANQAVQQDIANIVTTPGINLVGIVNAMDDNSKSKIKELLKKPDDKSPNYAYIGKDDDKYDSSIAENVAEQIVDLVEQKKQVSLDFYIAVLNGQISLGRGGSSTKEGAGDLEIINDEYKIENLVTDYIAEMRYDDETKDDERLHEIVASDIREVDSRIGSIKRAMEMIRGKVDCDILVPLYLAWKIGYISDDNRDRILTRMGYRKDFDVISEKIDAEKQERLSEQVYDSKDEEEDSRIPISKLYSPDLEVDRIGEDIEDEDGVSEHDEIEASQTADEITKPGIDKQPNHWSNPGDFNSSEIHKRMYNKGKIGRR
jgi:hypothetical protein